MVGCMLETKVAIAAGVSLVAAKSNITEADCDSFMYAVDPEMGMPGGFTIEVAYIHCLRNRVLVWIWISNSDNKCSAGMR